MGKKIVKTHCLLNGETLDLADLSARDAAFLAEIRKMAREDVDYFEIYRFAMGPGSRALECGDYVDRRLLGTPLYRVAEDLVTRAGIDQGLILAPEHEGLAKSFPTDSSMISVLQAADHIGILRAAIYKAIDKGTLRSLRIGNVILVERASAIEYRRARESQEPRATRPPE